MRLEYSPRLGASFNFNSNHNYNLTSTTETTFRRHETTLFRLEPSIKLTLILPICKNLER